MSADDTKKSLQQFLPPSKQPGNNHTDSSLDVVRPCEDLSWNHDKSTLHRSGTKGIAEGAVQRVKEGTAVLVQCCPSDGGAMQWTVVA